jgi:hypothetical protein
MQLPAGVTLSRSEGSLALGVEKHLCAQHDSAVILPRPIAPTAFDGLFLG